MEGATEKKDGPLLLKPSSPGGGWVAALLGVKAGPDSAGGCCGCIAASGEQGKQHEVENKGAKQGKLDGSHVLTLLRLLCQLPWILRR